MNITDKELKKVNELDIKRAGKTHKSIEWWEGYNYYSALMQKYGFHPCSYINLETGELSEYEGK